MTADIRTAAQREAERIITHEMHAEAITGALPFRVGFVDGAVWAQSRVTPTREQIARTLAMTDDYDGCFERIDAWEALEQWERDAQPQEEPVTDREDAEFWLRRADSVSAFMAGLAEGESTCES